MVYKILIKTGLYPYPYLEPPYTVREGQWTIKPTTKKQLLVALNTGQCFHTAVNQLSCFYANEQLSWANRIDRVCKTSQRFYPVCLRWRCFFCWLFCLKGADSVVAYSVFVSLWQMKVPWWCTVLCLQPLHSHPFIRTAGTRVHDVILWRVCLCKLHSDRSLELSYFYTSLINVGEREIDSVIRACICIRTCASRSSSPLRRHICSEAVA